jgi:hypothetical protein
MLCRTGVQPVTSPAAATESNQWDKRILMISPFGKASSPRRYLFSSGDGRGGPVYVSRGANAGVRTA